MTTHSTQFQRIAKTNGWSDEENVKRSVESQVEERPMIEDRFDTKIQRFRESAPVPETVADLVIHYPR